MPPQMNGKRRTGISKLLITSSHKTAVGSCQGKATCEAQ